MRKSEPANHQRKITGRVDRDASIPPDLVNEKRFGDGHTTRPKRTGVGVHYTKRDRVGVPTDDGDMFRPDPVCDDVIC